RSRTRSGAAASLLALLLAGAQASAAGEGRDPIEGKWLGQAGFPGDRIDIGFEFKQNEKRELKAYLYEPVLNFYGLELPGVVERAGATYTHKEYALTVTLRGRHARRDVLPAERPCDPSPRGDASVRGPGPGRPERPGTEVAGQARRRDLRS